MPSESSHASDYEFTDSDDDEEEGPDDENQAETAIPQTPRPDTPWKTRYTE